MAKLQIDDESISYISFKDHAKQITDIIMEHTLKLKINPKNLSLTDTTAGVGGNTISFANKFKHVNAIEIDSERCMSLTNNINIYELTNVTVFNGDCINLLDTLCDEVIFIDPPWGGKKYKDFDKLKLSLSNIPIETLCNKIIKKNDKIKLIVLKLPTNYDIDYLYKTIESNTIFFYDLKKMFIIVVQIKHSV